MSYLNSNEPYNRIEGQVWEGAGWGAAGGAAVAGATLGASYYNHAKIPHKAGVQMGKYAEEMDRIQQRAEKQETRNFNESSNLNQKRQQAKSKLKRSMLDRRINRMNSSHEKTMDGFLNDYSQTDKKYEKWKDPKALQDKSFYNKRLGGWKGKAGLFGLAMGGGAVLGGSIEAYRKGE